MTLQEEASTEAEETSVQAVRAIAEHCKELESLLLYILEEGMTKEAYRRIGECLQK